MPAGAVPVWAAIGTLVLAIAVFQLGNGFLGTLVSLRVDSDAFAPGIVGFVLASYFIGYTFGALRAASIIHRIGHIRAFAAFAGAAAASVVAMPLLVTWRGARSADFGDLFAYALARGLDLPLLFKGDDFARTDVERVPL